MLAALQTIAVSLFATTPALARADANHPVTQPASPEEEKKLELAQQDAEASKLPAVKVKTPAQLIRFSTSSDMLVAELITKDPPEDQHVVLPNPAVVATLHAFKSNGPAADGADNSQRFSLLLRDFSPGDLARAYTTVSSIDGRVQIARDYETAAVSGSVQLIQDPPPVAGQVNANDGSVRLLVQRTAEATGQSEMDLRFSADSFVVLCRAHPAEIDLYLRPILHDLGQEAALFAPDPRTIWQVLSQDARIDDATVDKVKGILGRYGADSFQERQAAAAELEKMGEPAALVLMHMDRTNFSAEQTSGIDTFLAPFLPLAPEESKRLGSDLSFLLNCQYSDDTTLRRLAADRLSKVLGHPAPIDPAAADDARAAQILAARDSLLKPTTAPTASGNWTGSH